MPILISNSENKFKQFRVRLKQSLYDEIKDYVNWADLNSINEFIEKASSYILEHDKEWAKDDTTF